MKRAEKKKNLPEILIQLKKLKTVKQGKFEENTM